MYVSLPPPQAILHQEGHMDDALTVARSQTEQSQAARMIYSTTGLFAQFIKYGPILTDTSHFTEHSYTAWRAHLAHTAILNTRVPGDYFGLLTAANKASVRINIENKIPLFNDCMF